LRNAINTSVYARLGGISYNLEEFKNQFIKTHNLLVPGSSPGGPTILSQ